LLIEWSLVLGQFLPSRVVGGGEGGESERVFERRDPGPEKAGAGVPFETHAPRFSAGRAVITGFRVVANRIRMVTRYEPKGAAFCCERLVITGLVIT